MTGPVINRKYVKKNKELKKVQKQNKKHYSRVRTKVPKARIIKIVAENGFMDLTDSVKESVNSQTEVLEAVKDAELTGMSGNGFPVYKKLKTFKESNAKEKILIVNGAECDPGLLHDEWLLRNRMQDIQYGMKVIEKAFQISQSFLAAKRVDIAASGSVNIKVLPNRYPVGAERILIKQVIGRDFTKNEIPVKSGVLVINVQTVISIGEIMKGTFNKKTRYITVADYATGQAKVAKVAYGMTVSDILKKVMPEHSGKTMYAGGGVMAVQPVKANDVVSETTNVVCYADAVQFDNDLRCKKCKACTSNCPVGVQVHKIVAVYDKKQCDDVKQFNADQCISCGTCSYMCAAQKNTMEIINILNK